jgi:HAE1 family hydrophobic/amphiphilic exporter-1
MFLSNLSIKRPVVATVMMLTLVTVGVFSWRRLPIELMPSVEIPVLSIVAEYPGASPEAVEREVSRKIEEAVNPIAGVKHVQSISREGFSTVVVEFNLEVKINDVSQEARAKINAMRRELPAGLSDPVIQKFDFQSMPIMSLAVRSTTMAPRDLTALADRTVKRRLENITGVARAKLVGSTSREVTVEVDPARLSALGMGIDEVVGGLASENVNTPLGRLTQGRTEMPLRISGKPASVDGFTSMVISRRGTEPIRLSDVADVRDGVEEQRSLALIDGEPAVAIDITKQTNANVVAVVDGVRAAIEELKARLPAGVEIQVVRDSSTFIREAVADVNMTLLLGAVLTVFIVFLFLNSWRSTVITGLTLPVSVISSFIVMYFLGMTMNMLTLMALSLAIGLLIDDAIVVRENIVRHLEHGEDHYEAAMHGTDEIGLAVLSTSMSIIAVFVPVAFMKGIIGRFFYQFGLTVAFAVLVSLFVSFTMDPMLSSRWHDPDILRQGRRSWWHKPLDAFNNGFERMAEGYKRVIGWSLDHRAIVSLAAVLAFVAGLAIFAVLPTEFMANMDQGEFAVKFTSAPGSSIAETRGRLAEVLKTLSESKEVQYTYASIGAGDSDTVRNATVVVKLVPKSERAMTLKQFVHDTRLRMEKIPGLQLDIQEEADAYQKQLEILVQGDDITTLKQYAAAVKRELYAVPGMVDISAQMENDIPEYRIVVDRERAAATGLGSGTLANTIGVLVGGQVVSTYEDEAGEAVNVRVRLPESLRGDVRQVADLKVSVPSQSGPALVPLADLVTFRRAASASEIGRRDLARQVTVGANLDGVPLGNAGTLALAAAGRVQMAPGYRVLLGGQSEIMVESFNSLAEALLLAIIFVYLILAAQFESFVDPLAIMFSLPLSIVGMAGMLYITGDTLSIMSLIGLIMLMGLVVKNAILLVDYTKVLRRRGLDRREAAIQAGRTRLRPILMTTSAMIFGMLPLFFALGQGAEMRAPMARAVVGGLITSTLLTLIVVPVVYTILDDVTEWLFGRKKQAAAAATTAALAAAIVLGAGATARAQQPVPAHSATATPAAPVTTPMADAIAQAAATTAPAEVRVLTLEQALAIAASQNRDIQKAIEYKKWVQGKYEQERAAALPQITFKGSLTKSADNSQSKLFSGLMPSSDSGSDSGGVGFGDVFGGSTSTRAATFSINQTVFTWGQVGAAIRAAKLGFDYSGHQLRRFQQAVTKDVTTSFYNILAAREAVRIAREDLAQKARHLDEVTKRQAAGTATDYDVLAAQVATENAKPAVIRSQNAVRAAREQLRFLLAEPREVDVEGTLATQVEPVPGYDEVLATALQNRPELGELKTQQGIYNELIKIAGAAGKPRVDFSASWGQQRLAISTLSGSGSAWSTALVATVPIFDGWRTKGLVAQARSDRATIDIEALKVREGIALEVRTAVDSAREAAELLSALSGPVKQAERLLALAEKGFELGVKTRLDVQDAELNLQAAQANLASAQRGYRVARVNLDWAAGTLDGGAAPPAK